LVEALPEDPHRQQAAARAEEPVPAAAPGLPETPDGLWAAIGRFCLAVGGWLGVAGSGCARPDLKLPRSDHDRYAFTYPADPAGEPHVSDEEHYSRRARH
jgi:hypothetical protein